MNLPFFEDADRKWEPRKRAGVDPKLSEVERAMLDTLDVIEQQSAYTWRVACRGWNLLLIVIAIFVLTNGLGILRVIQAWLGDNSPTP